MNENYVVEHIGYVTKNIGKTANTFKVFGYEAEGIVNADVHEAYNQLKEFGFTPLFSPVEAPAFGNRLICYFWKNDIGLIEVVEKEKGE